MKHFDSCRCEQCRKRPTPDAPHNCGFLMQQIIASGKQHLCCSSFCLTLGPLPRNLIPPLHISSVSLDGSVQIQEDSCSCSGHAQRVQAVLPLSVVVCDSRGQSHVTQSEICIPVSVCTPVHDHHSIGGQYLASAYVRLCRSCACFEPGQEVHVQLDGCVQVYLVSLRPVYSPMPCAPVGPDLPLYPQPCCPSR